MRGVVRENPPLVLSIGLFVVGIAGGLFVDTAPLATDPAAASDRTVWFFLTRNVVVAGIAFAGTLTFGVLTGVTLVYNGFVVGYAVANSARDSLTTALLLLPHGVFEIPAFWLAGAAGFRIPYGLFRHVSGERDPLLTADDLTTSVRWFLISCGLLLVAAWVEATVTPTVLLGL